MRANDALVGLSFVALLISFWNRNDIPGKIDYVDTIRDEPKQTKVNERPFSATVNDVDYLIEPEYAYELTGMIVSYRHHEGNSRMHLQANDHINMLDVCVIWGGNTDSELQKLDFWNGIFTCNVFTRDMQAWDSFDMNQLSNNHLISDDEYIRDRVKDVKIGDQIQVRGFLASYSNPSGGKRGTSTTRTDTGDGACETIFVQDFRIVQAATSYWRISMYAFLALLLFGLFVHFKRPYRPY